MAKTERTVNVQEFVIEILPVNTPSIFGMIPGHVITKLLVNAYIMGREHEKEKVSFTMSDGTILQYDSIMVRSMFGAL